MGVRRSRRGNPWHYPKGHPRGGQFAPAGTTGAVACETGKMFDRNTYLSLVNTPQYQNAYEQHYDIQTDRKWYQEPPSQAQIKMAKKIEKAANGKAPLPAKATRKDYADYNDVNRGYVEKPVSDRQMRAIEKLEKETGIPITHNAHALSEQHAGAYIGMAKKYSTLRNEANWTKNGNVRSCENFRVISHNGVYRIEMDVWRYRDKRDSKGRLVRDKNGNVVRERYKETVTLKDGVKNPHEAMRLTSNHVKQEYNEKYPNKTSRRRAPATIVGAQQMHFKLEDENEWKQNSDGTFTNGQYTIEMGTTGYHAYRTVDYKTVAHASETKHKRGEWVTTGCATPQEAMKECVEFNKKAYEREIQPNAASNKEIASWIAKYGKEFGIHSKDDYIKFARLNNNSRKDIDRRVKKIGARYEL